MCQNNTMTLTIHTHSILRAHSITVHWTYFIASVTIETTLATINAVPSLVTGTIALLRALGSARVSIETISTHSARSVVLFASTVAMFRAGFVTQISIVTGMATKTVAFDDVTFIEAVFAICAAARTTAFWNNVINIWSLVCFNRYIVEVYTMEIFVLSM